VEINEARMLARGLMSEHGVSHLGFRLSASKRVRGSCLFIGNEATDITLSRVWAVRLPERLVRDTVLHEIAHAIAGYDAGHGELWIRVAKFIGAQPTSTDGASEVHALHATMFKYMVLCPNHNCPKDVVDYIDRITKPYKDGKIVCKKCLSSVKIIPNTSHV
jgi:predicted SprT family Zn-dependent metalloprotease